MKLIISAVLAAAVLLIVGRTAFHYVPTLAQAQEVIHAAIKPQTDAPAQIAESHCGPTNNERSGYCEATVQFSLGKQHKTYGLRWLVTYDVNPQYKYEAGKLKGVPLSETDTVKAVVGAPDEQGKPARIINAEAELLFVKDADGSVWGDTTKAKRFARMLLQ